MDSDPLSNTYSWRWATGRHTSGKVGAASAACFAIFTEGRVTGTQGPAASAAPAEGANPRAEKHGDPAFPILRS
jgi:hypothetical protein